MHQYPDMHKEVKMQINVNIMELIMQEKGERELFFRMHELPPIF